MKKEASDYPNQVKSVEEIYDIACEADSVYILLWNRPQPAAWVISMQGRTIVRWIRNGYIYKK